jgi:hypothetical protein
MPTTYLLDITTINITRDMSQVLEVYKDWLVVALFESMIGGVRVPPPPFGNGAGSTVSLGAENGVHGHRSSSPASSLIMNTQALRSQQPAQVSPPPSDLL